MWSTSFFDSLYVLAMENIGDGGIGWELGLYTASSQVLFGFVKQIQENLNCVTSCNRPHLETRIHDYICTTVAMI